MSMQDEFYAEMRAVIRSSIQEELGAYKVPKEQHYQDHVWILDLRTWQKQTRTIITKLIIGGIVSILFALFLYGFIYFGKITF